MIEVQPQSPAPSGKAFAVQPVLQLLDERGLPVQQSGVEITASIALGPDQSALVHNASLSTDHAGKAAFRVLAITGAVGTYRLAFGAPGLVPDTSNVIGVSEPLVGSVQDPVGDMSGADLLSATLTIVRGDSILVSVRWAPGSFIRDTSLVDIFLDTDQDPATGHPGINATGTVDSALIGSEFIVVLGASQDVVADDVRLFRYSGTVGLSGELDIANHITYFNDGMDAVIPLSLLGPDDGLLNFKMVSGLKADATGFSGWLDVMPDVGRPAVAVAAGAHIGLSHINDPR